MTDIYIVDTSPYLYTATGFFFLSALSSDLLFIRFSLMCGFLFLVLASLSGHTTDGSFNSDRMLFVNGAIDITMLINAGLFLLNFVICARFLEDEWPKTKLTDEEEALFRFFQCRCGLTRLEFDEIRKHGTFVEMEANQPLAHVDSTLYLCLEGVVECKTKFYESQEEYDIFRKRSGQFFDIQLFNVFTLPVGFDSFEFQAQTVTKTRLFAWSINGLLAMRDCHSPNLQTFWEYIVLRSLAGAAVRHHLKDTDRLYDAWLIPEDPKWLEGAPSRDFAKPQLQQGTWSHLKSQAKQMHNSLWHIIPPKGIRHPPPSLVLKRNPKQDCYVLMTKAKQDCATLMAQAEATPSTHFLQPLQNPKETFASESNETRAELEQPVNIEDMAVTDIEANTQEQEDGQLKQQGVDVVGEP